MLLIKAPVAKRVNAHSRAVLNIVMVFAQRHHAHMILGQPPSAVSKTHNVMHVHWPSAASEARHRSNLGVVPPIRC